MAKKKVSLEIINPHAGGIDVGSRFHYVAIGQNKEDVKEFGVYAEDLLALTQWLLDNGVTTVAMESTGTYWQNLYSTLQEAGLKVTLANGKFTKNMQGKRRMYRTVNGYKSCIALVYLQAAFYLTLQLSNSELIAGIEVIL